MIKMTTKVTNLKNILLVLVFLGLSTAPSRAALNQEFQLGYVFDAWDSNKFIDHGYENRFPLSYRLSGNNFSIRLSTAFVLADYQRDATISSTAAGFKSDDMSDTAIQGAITIPMGDGLKSNIIGNLNLPTGNINWEANAVNGAVPYIFDSSYYHGRGLGADIFCFLSSSASGLRWGLGLGYLRTTTYYNSGLLTSDGILTPWGAMVGMATVGFPVGTSEDISFRVVHNLPFEATAQYVIYPFTLGQSTEIAGQWVKKMGGDKLQVTIAYNRYERGSFTDILNYSYIQESQAFLGDRFEIKPFLGWVLAPGVTMESGLNWRHVVSNGYSSLQTLYDGGGDLLGAQQSATFQMDPGTFWNFAVQYQYINHNDAAYDLAMQPTSVVYNRFTFGTNVGLKW